MSTEFRATYRLQFQPGFGFDDGAAVASYLADLGISHLYSSPCLQASPGSTHGYDVVDHAHVNEELGGNEAYGRLCETLAGLGMGQVLDIVPNHMAMGGPPSIWWEVLRHGQSSQYASYFDIDWERPEPWLRGAILLPILGDHYGRLIAAGEISTAIIDDQVMVTYGEQTFPSSPESVLHLLLDAGGTLAGIPSEALRNGEHLSDPPTVSASLDALIHDDERARASLAQALSNLNQDKDRLNEFLNRQHYRLSYWRSGEHRLNVRRFMDVTSLLGLRVEDPAVFQSVHDLTLHWVREGMVDGLRVDHPDGLYDPAQYLHRLAEVVPGAWLVVEKILGFEEELRRDWPVGGTTGYDFLNRVGGLFVDSSAEEALTDLYARFTGEPVDFRVTVRASKLCVLNDVLRSELNALATTFIDLCQSQPDLRDYGPDEIRDGLMEVIQAFPIYRTYVVAETGRVSEADVSAVKAALCAARKGQPSLGDELFDFLGDLLLLRVHAENASDFAMRFQQISGPVMAKAVEDTAFYRYYRLASLNEVGGAPEHFGVSIESFHEWCSAMQRNWPRGMLATSTHDAKRGEDVRLRISMLSQMPDRWAEAVKRWTVINERHRQGDLLDRNTEYLLYQTLVGTWPIEPERVLSYMEKAIREAKVHTSWRDLNQPYEDAVRAFIQGVMGDERFTADLDVFVSVILGPSRVASLGQTLAKLMAPGVPDMYQGSDLWDLNLVDPDNRRAIDFNTRRELLATLDQRTPEEIWRESESGLPKLWVIRQALALRARDPEAFGRGASYEPLRARGSRADDVVAFARSSRVIAAFPRIVVDLDSGWDDTFVELPLGVWRNVLTGDIYTGGVMTASELFRRFPVALLSLESHA